MKIRPSALPQLEACPRWQSDGTGNKDTDAGQKRHDYLAALLDSALPADELAEIAAEVPEPEREAVEWAADYIRTKAPMADHPLRVEHHVNPLDGDFRPLFENGGRLDVACGNVLFDLKSRERDYRAQMAAYALDMFQEHGWQTVEIHLLFSETKRPQVYSFTEPEAAEIVYGTIAKVKDPEAKPRLCSYCSWCSARLTCPAQLAAASHVATAREDLPNDAKIAFEKWIEAGAHVSQIETADTMGAVLRIARALAGWCEAAEHAAKELATKKGMVPSGFKLQNRQGNRFITSVVAAFRCLGLPQDDFLKACEIKPSAAFDLYATFHGLKKAAAEKDVVEKLAHHLQRRQTTTSLVAIKD